MCRVRARRRSPDRPFSDDAGLVTAARRSTGAYRAGPPRTRAPWTTRRRARPTARSPRRVRDAARRAPVRGSSTWPCASPSRLDHPPVGAETDRGVIVNSASGRPPSRSSPRDAPATSARAARRSRGRRCSSRRAGARGSTPCLAQDAPRRGRAPTPLPTAPRSRARPRAGRSGGAAAGRSLMSQLDAASASCQRRARPHPRFAAAEAPCLHQAADRDVERAVGRAPRRRRTSASKQVERSRHRPHRALARAAVDARDQAVAIEQAQPARRNSSIDLERLLARRAAESRSSSPSRTSSKRVPMAWVASAERCSLGIRLRRSGNAAAIRRLLEPSGIEGERAAVPHAERVARSTMTMILVARSRR